MISEIYIFNYMSAYKFTLNLNFLHIYLEKDFWNCKLHEVDQFSVNNQSTCSKQTNWEVNVHSSHTVCYILQVWIPASETTVAANRSVPIMMASQCVSVMQGSV